MGIKRDAYRQQLIERKEKNIKTYIKRAILPEIFHRKTITFIDLKK